jgi:ABC-type polar amino acid transport system ATPase subunit
MALEQRKNMLSTMLFDELESGLDNNSLCKVLNIIKSLKNQQLITSLKHQTLPKKIKGNILYPTQN